MSLPYYLIHWRPSNMRLRKKELSSILLFPLLFHLISMPCGSIYYGDMKGRGVYWVYTYYGQQLIRIYKCTSVLIVIGRRLNFFNTMGPIRKEMTEWGWRWMLLREEKQGAIPCRYLHTRNALVCVYIDTIRGWNRVPPPLHWTTVEELVGPGCREFFYYLLFFLLVVVIWRTGGSFPVSTLLFVCYKKRNGERVGWRMAKTQWGVWRETWRAVEYRH